MTVDWLSGLAMLLSGLIIGFLIVYSMKRGKVEGRTRGVRLDAARHHPPAPASADGRDLVARRDALLEQLRDVGDNQTERGRLEREAAEVLRALDGVKPAERAVAAGLPASTGSSSREHQSGMNPVMKGFLWGALSTGALCAMGWYVARSATPREQAMPVTGAANPQVTQQQQPPQSDGKLQALEVAVKEHPDDLKLRDELAKAYFDRENMMAVFEQTKYVLERAPDDPKALTYGALVRMAMGQDGPALGMLQKATQRDPSLTDAWVGLAWLYTQAKRPGDAASAIQSAVRQHPEEQARLNDVLEQMRARSTTAPSGPAQTPPASGRPDGGEAGQGRPVQVTIALASGAKVPPGGVLFLYARAAGVTSGPPAAVKRLAVTQFPMDVELSGADSMMGQPLPSSMRIEARIDADGNPITHDAADIGAAQDGVRAGATITLTLR